MREHTYDVVVIGSGAGGGTVARELAPLVARGLSVAVLERGPRLRPQDLTGTEVDLARRIYADAGGFLTRDLSMTLAFAHAYGGSTTVYTGTSLALPRRVTERWAVDGLTHDDVAARSAKYLAENNAHLIPEQDLSENNRLFRDGCRLLGLKVEQFPVNVKGCRGTGLCNLYCSEGAKQGTHRVQLPQAEQSGVEVVTCCRVDRVFTEGCHVTVEHPQAGDPSRWPAGGHVVHARIIVVAAGAVGSPALLVRSALPARLPTLGRYFTCHPAMILVGRHDRPVSARSGHPKSFFCDEFVEDRRFLLETCMYFPFVTAKSMVGFGSEHREFMSNFDKLQMILALGIDEARPENRVTVDSAGKPVVDYTIDERVYASLNDAARTSARIFFAAGASAVHVPSSPRFALTPADLPRLDELTPPSGMKPGRVSVAAAHLMGGCRMGAGPSDSVTDAWGRVHGLPWLRVADASLFPAAAEINPYITVMALADRVAEGVRKDLGA